MTDGVVIEPGGEAGLHLTACPSAYPSVPPGCLTGTQVEARIREDGKPLAAASKSAH